MMKWINILVIYGLGIWPGGMVQSQEALVQREIGKIIRYEASINFDLVPGILIGVMDGDSTYTFSVGQKQNKYQPYEMGSVTKPVIAWLAGKALDSLGWSTEKKVCAFLPDSFCGPGWKELTIEQLLTHRAGLMRLPPGIGEAEVNIDDPYVAYDVDELAKDIQLVEPRPGIYSYSHINFMVLHWLFERVGGMDYFLERKLIRPLSLMQTGFEIPDDEMAPGFGRNGSPAPLWHCNALNPALGLRSGLLDLISFIRYVSPDLITHAPPWTEGRKKTMEKQIKDGIYDVVDGWFLVPERESWVFYHNGFTGGHHVSIAFIPEKQIGAIVIANGSVGSGELSILILEMLHKAKGKSK
jgi:CubicO group peptidase (beta-lactamase class C family)